MFNYLLVASLLPISNPNSGFICRKKKMLSLRQTSFPFSKPDGKFSTEESRLAYAKLEKEWSQLMKSLPEDEESEAEESEVEESEAEEESETEESEADESEVDESEVEESEVDESEVEESEAEESEAEDINSESDADEEPPRNLTAINQNMRNLSMPRQDKANYA